MNDNDDEVFKRQLRPSRFLRWASGWDIGGVITGFLYFVVAVIAILYLLALIPTSQDAVVHARELLEREGYMNIEVTDVGFWSCGHGDVLNESAAFRALTPSGMRVEGAVCCGWVQDCAIRYK